MEMDAIAGSAAEESVEKSLSQLRHALRICTGKFM